MHPPRELTVVIADDHAMVREAFAALCTKIGIRVVGQAADGQTAVDLVLELKPDFALLDMDMPRLTGTEAVRKIRASESKTKLLILTLTSDGPTVRAAFSAGADGYLLKSGTLQQFQDAIREAMEGLIYLAPELRRAAIVAGGSTPAPEKSDPLKDLSPREIEVFDLLVREYRIKEIAEKLDLNPKTIDTYWTSIRRKLGVDSIAALVKFAIKHRLIDPEDPAPKKPR